VLPWGCRPQGRDRRGRGFWLVEQRASSPCPTALGDTRHRRRADVRRLAYVVSPNRYADRGSAIAVRSEGRAARDRASRGRSSSPRRRRHAAREIMDGCDTRRVFEHALPRLERRLLTATPTTRSASEIPARNDPRSSPSRPRRRRDRVGRRAGHLRITTSESPHADDSTRDEPVVFQDAPGMMPVDGRAASTGRSCRPAT